MDLVALVKLVERVLQLALPARERRPQICLLFCVGAIAQRQLMFELVDGLPALFQSHRHSGFPESNVRGEARAAAAQLPRGEILLQP